MLGSVVLFENFNASYTSFLSVVSQAKPFHTIEELDLTGLKIGAAKGTAFQTMFKVGKLLDISAIVKTLIKELSKPTSERLALGARWDWSDSYKDGVERAMRENYAFMGGVQTVYLILGEKRLSYLCWYHLLI